MLRRAAVHGRTDDSGMSVVEVVVAAFILFFVLTAVLGLIGATTKTSIIAKQRTAMTNAVASYIEYVRSLPFDQVALSSVEPSGAVDPQVTIERDGFRVVLTNSISSAAYGLKELQVQALCTANSTGTAFRPMHTSAFAAVRDRLLSSNELGQPHSGGPVIEFGHLTPPENSVLYDANVQSAGSSYVDASVETSAGSIQAVEFRVGDQRLRNGTTTSATEAYWTPGTSSSYHSILWDTRQVRDDTSEPSVRDGWRIVRVMATDELGRRTFKDRRFLIDNYAPEDPGQPTGVPRTNVTTLVTWLKSMDGTDPAKRYELEAWKEYADGSGWFKTGLFSLTQPAHTLSTTTLGRYWVRVRALSARGLSSNWIGCTGPFVARPLLSGTASMTITGSGSSKSSTLVVDLSHPAIDFPASNIRYDIYRGTSASTLALVRSSTTASPFTETIVQSITGTVKVPTAYYYQLRVTYTPTGYAGGYEQTSVSNLVGPTPIETASVALVPTW